jgi:hypothetical protein
LEEGDHSAEIREAQKRPARSEMKEQVRGSLIGPGGRQGAQVASAGVREEDARLTPTEADG